MASTAAMEDAQSMGHSALYTRLQAVASLRLSYSAMVDEFLPKLRQQWLVENARQGQDSPPPRIAAQLATQDISNLVLEMNASDTEFFRSLGISFPSELRLPASSSSLPSTATPPPVACCSLEVLEELEPLFTDDDMFEDLSSLSGPTLALAQDLFGSGSDNEDAVMVDVAPTSVTHPPASLAPPALADPFPHQAMVYSPASPPRRTDVPLASASQPDTRFDLDMAFSDAWAVAVIDITVQDGRPWGDPETFCSTMFH